MKILFLAKHGPFDNADEDAVTYALRCLGHEVIPVQQDRGRRTKELDSVEADLCLFFKHPVVSEIVETSKRMPCAYWHFDLIDSDDPTLRARSDVRIGWCADVYRHVIAGFHTDGDWVKKINERPEGGKLVHLTQGADERFVGFGAPGGSRGQYRDLPPVVFFGMVHHGRQRADHVEALKKDLGGQFVAVGDHPNTRVHGLELADLCASAKVIIAPDGPVTNLYASNRIYLVSGFGGFLLHPYSEHLTEFYRPGMDIQYYSHRDHLRFLVNHYITNHHVRAAYARAAYDRTVSHNLYRHRAARLIQECERRMTGWRPK
jgi:hypothetical protein